MEKVRKKRQAPPKIGDIAFFMSSEADKEIPYLILDEPIRPTHLKYKNEREWALPRVQILVNAGEHKAGHIFTHKLATYGYTAYIRYFTPTKIDKAIYGL